MKLSTEKIKALKTNDAVYCKTKEEFKLLFEKLDEMGLRWKTGTSYKIKDAWSAISPIVYYPAEGSYGNLDFAKSENYKIFELADLMEDSQTIKLCEKKIRALTKSQVIHCPTYGEAVQLCNKLHDMGRQWNNGELYSNTTKWDNYQDTTCYRITVDQSCSLGYYKKEGYEILTLKDLAEKMIRTKYSTGYKLDSVDVFRKSDGRIPEDMLTTPTSANLKESKMRILYSILNWAVITPTKRTMRPVITVSQYLICYAILSAIVFGGYKAYTNPQGLWNGVVNAIPFEIKMKNTEDVAQTSKE